MNEIQGMKMWKELKGTIKELKEGRKEKKKEKGNRYEWRKKGTKGKGKRKGQRIEKDRYYYPVKFDNEVPVLVCPSLPQEMSPFLSCFSILV